MNSEIKTVLNIGGGSKSIPLPAHFKGWKHILLDIEAHEDVDIVMDARDLGQIQERFDAIYCSHNLEHYYGFEVPKILKQMQRCLKSGGVLEVHTPDIREVMQRVVQGALPLDATLYTSGHGAIQVLDILYGFQSAIQGSGNTHYAHKTGFDALLLRQLLLDAGFYSALVVTLPEAFELRAWGFTAQPTRRFLQALGLPGI